MKHFAVLIMTISVLAVSCRKNDLPKPVPTPNPPSQKFLLKDIVERSLPSPYYFFEYDGLKRIAKASFSSGEGSYDLLYNGNRLGEVKSTHIINKDRLEYQYDDAGRVSVIRILDKSGAPYRVGFLDYDFNGRLKEIEWMCKADTPGFAQEQTLSFTYGADGNLSEMRNEKFAIAGRQLPILLIDRFEQYDDKVNVDGFTLLHTYNQHMIFLPGVQLQRNNPLKVTRTGTGVRYTIDYQYNYTNDHPVERTGDLLIQSGDAAGQHTELKTWFTYYQL